RGPDVVHVDRHALHRRVLVRHRRASLACPGAHDRTPSSEGASVASPLSDLCKGRVCIVTGAGRGIGREEALMLAAHGAKVVVNDLGAAADGTGSDKSPAQQVVEEIRAAGGEAVANGDDVSDFESARRMVDQAISSFGRLDVLVNNAGILRDRMLVNMS